MGALSSRSRIVLAGAVVSTFAGACDSSGSSGGHVGNSAAGAAGSPATPLGGGGAIPGLAGGAGAAVASTLGGASSPTTLAGAPGAGGTWSSTSASGLTVLAGSASIGGNENGGAPLGVAGSSAAGGTTPLGSACNLGLGNYCECMPRFLGSQSVDGAGDEFSVFAPMTFALVSAPYVNAGRAGAQPETVTLRAAWSDVGLHVHVHVEDPSIVPDSSATLWNGDNVQLFAAPTGDLTGTYMGTEDGGAIHVLISAPDLTDVSRAVVIYQNGAASNSTFVNGLYATRRVAGGYEVEVQLKWLPAAAKPQSRGRVGFDLLVGAASDSSVGLALEGGLANNPVSGSSPACELGGRVQPGCDDRTWCRPLLQ